MQPEERYIDNQALSDVIHHSLAKRKSRFVTLPYTTSLSLGLMQIHLFTASFVPFRGKVDQPTLC